MKGRKFIVLNAYKKSLLLRNHLNVSETESFCIFDTIDDKLGIEVRFVDIPSMEATYIKADKPSIMVSSLRPPPRRAYNAAHELGHHVFGHGSRLDEVNSETFEYDNDELLADSFAGFFLMPRKLVSCGFGERGFSPASCSSVQFYTVTCWLGVGYETLIKHMHTSLNNMISSERTKILLKDSPKKIRERLTGVENNTNLIIVDEFWRGKAIDIQVDDIIHISSILKPDIEGDFIEKVSENANGIIFRGIQPGVGRISDRKTKWTSYVRVSRKEYVGLSRYRHEEEDDDD